MSNSHTPKRDPLKDSISRARSVGDGKFFVKRKIRSGAFGDVFLGIHIKERFYVAVKREPKDSIDPQLYKELRVYSKLKGCIGFPHVHWFGIEGNFTYLIMDFLGPSLDDLLNFCGGKFTLKTTLMIGIQLIQRIETLHSRDICHWCLFFNVKFLFSDIKPENFLVGIADPTLIHLIDFGLTMKYRDPKTKEHIPCLSGYSMVGTARYASLNAHHGLDLSRRDDLESIAYLLIYFLKGFLPWQANSPNSQHLDLNDIFTIKENTSLDILCDNIPPAFRTLLHSCKSLKFEEKPNYNYITNLLKDCLEENQLKFDGEYDWVLNVFILIF